MILSLSVLSVNATATYPDLASSGKIALGDANIDSGDFDRLYDNLVAVSNQVDSVNTNITNLSQSFSKLKSTAEGLGIKRDDDNTSDSNKYVGNYNTSITDLVTLKKNIDTLNTDLSKCWFGNAEASNVLSGKTFTAGRLIGGSDTPQQVYTTGTMTNKAGATVEATKVSESADKTKAEISIPVEAYYDTESKVSVPIETIKKNVTSLNNSIKTVDGSFASYGSGTRTSTVSVSVPIDANIVGAAMTYVSTDGNREDPQSVFIGAISRSGTTVSITMHYYTRHSNTLDGKVRLFYF